MGIKGQRKPAKPCKNCGCEEVYASSRQCVVCSIESGKKRKKKRDDLKNYGVTFDKQATERRRAIEERQERGRFL